MPQLWAGGSEAQSGEAQSGVRSAWAGLRYNPEVAGSTAVRRSWGRDGYDGFDGYGGDDGDDGDGGGRTSPKSCMPRIEKRKSTIEKIPEMLASAGSENRSVESIERMPRADLIARSSRATRTVRSARAIDGLMPRPEPMRVTSSCARCNGASL